MSTAVLVADGLADQGFEVRDPVMENLHFLKVINARHAYCEIMISETGAVTWEYRRFDGRLGPAQITAMVMSILGAGNDGRDDGPLAQQPGLTLKGIVGQASRERGMQAAITILDPDDFCELDAEVRITNPAMPSRGAVQVNDEGMIIWDCCLTEPTAGHDGINPGRASHDDHQGPSARRAGQLMT
jgi:hypothetical protein